MALTMIAPTKRGGLAVIIVVQEENLRRMKQHDPMELHSQLAGLHEAHVASIVIAYATDEEFELYTELGAKGETDKIIKMIYSGWKVEEGKDIDTQYEILNPIKTDKPQ